MASLFNSKHNKYVSIPDWFKDVQPTVEKPVETKTTYIGSSGGNSTAGLSNIALYNKFVLEDAELDNDALIFENIVLNTIKTEEHKIGDELQATGWSTTDFISVAGNSKMTIVSKIVVNENQYGIIFYDNTRTIINSIALKESPEEIQSPANAFYFRISTPSGYEDFKITYSISADYTSEQLELSNNAQSDYLTLNEEIPEGFNQVNSTPKTISLLVQPPLTLTKDVNDIIKLSIKDTNIASDVNDMFVWDKKLAAFGYDKELKQAYSYLDGEQQFTTNDKGEEVPVMTDNPEFWMYDPELTNDWIIKTTRQRFSVLDGLMEYDAEKDSFLFHKNIITSGGVVMYADLGDVKVPDLYDGFPLDGITIKWNYDEEGNKINISSVGAGIIKSIDVQGEEGNVLEHVALDEETGILTFYKFNKYTLQDDFDVLQERIDNIKDELLDHFVTVDSTEQYVSGIKHFENGIFIGNRKLYEWKDDVIYLDSNLVVRGGITMYGDEYQSGGDSGQGLTETQVRSLIESYNFITLNDIHTATATVKGIASFGSTDFDISEGHVTLKTHIHIGTPSTYDNNTLYIIA